MTILFFVTFFFAIIFESEMLQYFCSHVSVLTAMSLIVLMMWQEWNDYNLRWNDSDYGGVKDLRITPNKLWKPDVLMYNR